MATTVIPKGYAIRSSGPFPDDHHETQKRKALETIAKSQGDMCNALLVVDRIIGSLKASKASVHRLEVRQAIVKVIKQHVTNFVEWTNNPRFKKARAILKHAQRMVDKVDVDLSNKDVRYNLRTTLRKSYRMISDGKLRESRLKIQVIIDRHAKHRRRQLQLKVTEALCTKNKLKDMVSKLKAKIDKIGDDNEDNKKANLVNKLDRVQKQLVVCKQTLRNIQEKINK